MPSNKNASLPRFLQQRILSTKLKLQWSAGPPLEAAGAPQRFHQIFRKSMVVKSANRSVATYPGHRIGPLLPRPADGLLKPRIVHAGQTCSEPAGE